MAVWRIPVPADYGPAAAVERASGGPPCPLVAIPCTDRALWMRVIRHARCAGSSLDPDQWFPVSVEIGKARREAAARSPWAPPAWSAPSAWRCRCGTGISASTGVWGGLAAAERAALPRRRHAAMIGTSPGEHGLLMAPIPGVGTENPLAGGPRTRWAEHLITPPRPRWPSLVAPGTAGTRASAGLLNETPLRTENPRWNRQ